MTTTANAFAIDVLDALCARTPPVGLDTLVAVADLQERVDRKYIVPADIAVRALDRAETAMAVLDIDGRRRFHYRSDYYDSPDLQCFRQHVQDRRGRIKVRARTYLDSGESWLEVKVSGRRGLTAKTRRSLAARPGRLLPDTARELVLAVAPGLADGLERSAVTTYERCTFLLAGSGRVTVDTGLELAVDGRHRRPRPGVTIIETKTPGRPGPVDHALWRLGARPASVSKYCLAIALLRPDARSNPWHRVIRRHFDPDA